MSKTMMGVVYHGKGDLRFEEIAVPQIRDPRDAIVKVGLSSICTSDLHIRHGAVPRAEEKTVLGHEFAGEVVEVGSLVRKLKPGMRVVCNVETYCGECFFCKRGFVNNCVHGGWELGCRIDGCQTEYVRVPYADNGLTPVPDKLDYEDVIMVSCILPSGYFGAELAAITPGDVVVLGAGPVGYTTMMSARLFGPSVIVATDLIDERLDFAKKHGWADVTVNPQKENLEEVVLSLTDGRGADAVVEAAGGPTTFETAWQIARPNAVVSVIAMYEEPQVLPLPQMYGKNLIFKTGGVDASKNDILVKLIEGGKINARPMLTHHMPLNDVIKGYDMFENHADGCIKVAITPYQR
ncbi:MAG: alcohol dehydrogenase [Planctomycetaceae bacterium]|nr:alcohol dehydrogenase [Planctomycetaceae bacterium]